MIPKKISSLSKEKINEILDQYVSGVPVLDLMLQYNFNGKTFNIWLSNYWRSMDVPAFLSIRRFRESEAKTILQQYASGVPLEDLIDYYDFTVEWFCFWAKEYGDGILTKKQKSECVELQCDIYEEKIRALDDKLDELKERLDNQKDSHGS